MLNQNSEWINWHVHVKMTILLQQWRTSWHELGSTSPSAWPPSEGPKAEKVTKGSRETLMVCPCCTLICQGQLLRWPVVEMTVLVLRVTRILWWWRQSLARLTNTNQVRTEKDVQFINRQQWKWKLERFNKLYKYLSAYPWHIWRWPPGRRRPHYLNMGWSCRA